ncbi:MAG: tautomerase family protein [Methanobacteriaceae archaeon]|jgi:4-oxalocrotonate tautomerase|nr:tautomerase family protein [Methanobacteriaceae archaeon]
MPVVRISGNDEISKKEKSEMVKEVTKTVSKAYKLPEQAITVIIDECASENVGVGGKLLCDNK